MLYFKKMIGFGFILLILASVMACQTPAGRSAGQVIDDAAISTKVKAKLFDDETIKGFAISVETFEGQVTLTGGVKNERQKERAGQIAQSVGGVRTVNNLIDLINE